VDSEEYRHWAEVIAQQAVDKFNDGQVIATGWSPSGEYHYGNFREAVTCNAIYQSVKDLGEEVKFLFNIDDYDPLDKIPTDLKKYSRELRPYLGHPINRVPDFTGEYDSYADYFAAGARKAAKDFHFDIEFIRSSKLYQSGKYDDFLRQYLAHQDIIDELFEDISGSALNSYVAVVCKECGNMKTPQVQKIEDEKIYYKCISDRMFRGCDDEGFQTIDSHEWKLKWRLDWPARQTFLGVTVEPSGKDHSVAGGSVDTSLAIHEKIFEHDPPILERYGFITLKGQKASGSKGGFLPAAKISSIMPPSTYMFLIYRSDMLKDIDFNPQSLEYAKLMDEFDDARRMYEGDEFPGREREYNKLATAADLAMFDNERGFLPAQVKFEELALVYQTSLLDKDLTITKLDDLDKIPSEMAKKELYRRLELMDQWLAEMAPANIKFQFLDTVPDGIAEYWSDPVRTTWTSALNQITPATTADEFTQFLREAGDANDLSPKEYYQAFYQLISGKSSGPNAAGLVMAMGKDSILEKIKEL